MEKRPFGSTDMRVSVLGLGGHELNDVPIEQARAIVQRALDVGVNVIDTAECYGCSEQFIGEALGQRRGDCYLFTKCGHASGIDLPDWHPGLLEESIERSLRRLKTDYLDLVQLHSCSRQVLARGEVIEVLQRARAAGKARYIGYSGDRRDARYAIRMGVFDALQTSINVADQESIDLTLGEARARQMGIIAKRPIANAVWKAGGTPVGVYRDRLHALHYDFLAGESSEIVSIALRFTLTVPGVAVAIVGTTNPNRIEQNLALLASGPLPPAQFEAIRARWKALTWWRKPFPDGRWGWRGWA